MTKYLKLFGILLIFTAISCKSGQENQLNNKHNAPAVAEETNTPEIPGVPEEVLIKLFNECDYVDYIFHKLPFSLSQNEDPSIKQSISFIDFERPLKRIPKGCKPDARKFFHIKGQIVYDVDVYLLNGCHFYVFVDQKGKPIYANYMTETGVNYYNGIINQAKGMNPNNQ